MLGMDVSTYKSGARDMTGKKKSQPAAPHPSQSDHPNGLQALKDELVPFSQPILTSKRTDKNRLVVPEVCDVA